MKIPVVWYEAQRGYWDHALIMEIFEGTRRRLAFSYEYEYFDEAPKKAGGILILAAKGLEKRIPEVQKLIDSMPWVLIFAMSDEENCFPWKRLELPQRSEIWIQYPRPGLSDGADRFLCCGYPMREEIPYVETPPNVWFFSGQIFNPERLETALVMRDRQTKNNDGHINQTPGFGQGMGRENYVAEMLTARVVPSPGGNVTADTFRTHEALEMGMVPIASARNSGDPSDFSYWDLVYGDPPFPRIDNWSELPALLDLYADEHFWRREANRCWAWWQRQKRKLSADITNTVRMLSGADTVEPGTLRNAITVLIPTSPIPNTLSTKHIEETIGSIRAQPELVDCEIILMIDAVREEQSEYEKDYERYKRHLLHMANNRWTNVLPLDFRGHTHQAGMTRAALYYVRTPMILFVEHDTPIVGGVNFRGITQAIAARSEVNVVRLHYDVSIHADHQHLMLDDEPQSVGDVRLLRTQQWSQRPHVASTEFYQEMLNKHFSEDACTMIEDCVHGPLQASYSLRGDAGWVEWGTWIYADGWPDDMKRSGHSDARKGDSKFESDFKF